MREVDNQEEILKEMINREKQIEEKQNNKQYDKAQKLNAEYRIFIVRENTGSYLKSLKLKNKTLRLMKVCLSQI